MNYIRQTGENSLHNVRIFITEEADYITDNLFALVGVATHEVVNSNHCSTSDVGLKKFGEQLDYWARKILPLNGAVCR